MSSWRPQQGPECGQSRLCGRLPVANFFIAGQSALVPGVMGTMLTSFTVFRLAVGEAEYRQVCFLTCEIIISQSCHKAQMG